MLEAKKEQVSEILIPETINNDPSTKTTIIVTADEGLTRDEQMEACRRMQTRQEVLGRVNLNDQLPSEVTGLPNGWGEGYPYIHFKDLIVKCRVKEQDASDLLQMYGYRTPGTGWCREMEDYGFIFNFRYAAYDREFDVLSQYDHDVLSPHGHRFFEELFTGGKLN